MCSKRLISGNGEGQRQNNDEGDIKQCNTPDTVLLDEGKANFLHDLHPYHLYAWELFEKTDRMDGVMGMLDLDISFSFYFPQQTTQMKQAL